MIGVGAPAEGVALEPRSGLAVVAEQQPPALAVVDPVRRRVLRRIALPAPARHVRDAGGGEVMAAGGDTVVRLSPGRPASITAPVLLATGTTGHDVARAAGRLFVADPRRGLLVVDPAGAPRTLAAPAGAHAVSAVGSQRVAVLGAGARELALYDARSLRELGRVNAGVGSTHIDHDGRGYVYAVDTQGDAVLHYRTRPRLALVCRLNVAGRPYGIAVDRRRGRAYVTTTSSNRLVELRLRGALAPLTVTSHPTVRQPNAVTVDQRLGRVLVTGRAHGALQVLTAEAMAARR